MKPIIEKAKKIKCVISDVDGVLTNGLLFLNDHGYETKAFNVQDGMGLKLLMAAGIHVAIITTSRSDVIEHRMKQLGIEHYFKNCVDKREAFSTLKQRLSIADDEYAYIGDDLPDIAIIKQVGLGIAVENAVSHVKEVADYITLKSGGNGGVREVCDLILTAQGKFDGALQRYLES